MPEYTPPVSFRFKVEFDIPEINIGKDGLDVRFQEVTGLTAELGIETLEEGGENGFSHRFPNRAKYNNLVLKRGLLSNSQLIQWFKDAIINFEFAPATVTVILLNDNREPLESWNFKDVWPVKWAISDFKAQDNALTIETVELAYSFFERN